MSRALWHEDRRMHILSANRDDRYELADYDSLKDLENALRDDLRKALMRSSATT
jgi:hypothetical protein